MLTPCRKNSKLKKLQVKRWLRNEQADFYPETFKKKLSQENKKADTIYRTTQANTHRLFYKCFKSLLVKWNTRTTDTTELKKGYYHGEGKTVK